MKNSVFILIFLLLVLCKITFAQETQSQDYLKYKDTKFHFLINYPNSWKQVEPSHPIIRLELISENGNGTANFNISVVEVKGSENVTTATYVKLVLEDKPELISEMAKKNLSNAKVVSSGKTYLSNQEALFMIFEGNYRSLDEITELKVYQLQMFYEGRIYTLAFGCLKEEFAKYFQIFKYIASSFGVVPTKFDIPKNKKVIPKKPNKPNK